MPTGEDKLRDIFPDYFGRPKQNSSSALDIEGLNIRLRHLENQLAQAASRIQNLETTVSNQAKRNKVLEDIIYGFTGKRIIEKGKA